MFTPELNAPQTDFHQLGSGSANHKSYACHLQDGSSEQVSGDDLRHSAGLSGGHIPELPARTYFSQTRANAGDVSRVSSEIYAPWSSPEPSDRGPNVAGDVGSSQCEPSEFSPHWLSTEHIHPWMREARATQKQKVANFTTKTGLNSFDVSITFDVSIRSVYNY